MFATNHLIRNKIIAFFVQQPENKKHHLLSVLCQELDSLLEQAQMLDVTEVNGVNKLAHNFKGLCGYLKIQNEPVFHKISGKQELLLNILMLKDEIEVVKSEI